MKADPFGFIPPGPLFGWNIDEDRFRTCNNPYWWTGPATGTQQYPPGSPNIKADDTARTKFTLHWFACFGEDYMSIDACHSIGPAPAGLASGREDVGDYYAHASDNNPTYEPVYNGSRLTLFDERSC